MRQPDAASDGLLLVTGVPGIGKTHLADHFVEQRARDRSVEGIVVDTDLAASPEGLLAVVGEAMGAKDEFCEAAGVADRLSGARASAAGVVSGGFTTDVHRPALGFGHMLQATKGLKAWRKRALVVVVDEVQNLTAESAEQVRTLHMGRHGCPIFALAAGLAPAKGVLSKHGISRVSHRTLGLLTPDESMDAVYHGLANLGFEVREDTARELAEASMCFPQHVNRYMEAAVNVAELRGEIDSREVCATC